MQAARYVRRAQVVTTILMAGTGVGALPAQQQVKVSVTATPNPIAAGSCTRISPDVRDELNRALTLENGIPLQWSSYDYAASNGVDFEWRSGAAGEFELCAKPGAAAVSTQITATVKGTAYSGATVVTVAAPAAAATPVQTAISPPTSAPAAQAPYAAAAAQVPVSPNQGYASAPQAAAPAGETYAQPAQTAGGAAQTPGGAAAPQTYATSAQPSGAPAQPYSAAPGSAPAAASAPGAAPLASAPAPQPVEAQPAAKSGGGFFKKLGGHLKQKVADVKLETVQNLSAAAAQVVDTTFQTGSRLVSSTTAEVANTARMGIGGVGRQLMLAPQRGGAAADNLALAISSGRAILLELRFTPNTDVLEPAARELVVRLADELRKAIAASPTASFVIEAHVDSVANGQVLSEHRAAAVKVALLRNGIEATRLMALGYGASRPLHPGGPPVARVEIARAQ